MADADVGTCDACKAEDVSRVRYRLVRSSGEQTSRSVALCASCRAPIEVLLRIVPPKVSNEPIVPRDVDELVPSKTLLAQRVAPRKRRKAVDNKASKATPSDRS